jgi:hypothetical protein
MKLFIIIVLMCLAGLAFWPKKPAWKRSTARTWPAAPRKTGLKPKLATRL